MPAPPPRAKSRQRWTLGHCPECLTRFDPVHPRQLFCSEAHQRRYNDRWRVRGRNIGLLLCADRQTRGASIGDTDTGRRARKDHQFLAQRYLDEDRTAGRMPAVDFVRLRYSLGFDRP